MRIQAGYVYERSGSFYIRYWTSEIVDGQPRRVQRSERLCGKDDKYYSRKAKSVRLLAADFMNGVNQEHAALCSGAADMVIADFWEKQFLPHCETPIALTGKPRKKPSTMRGYRQIWRQHLAGHFGKLMLTEYEPSMGTQFLESLTGTQNKNTIRHIKALGCAIFKRAVNEQRLKVNPWHDVQMPDDAFESPETQHYTWEEAENIVSALVDRVDCQLIVALACFLGLRPGEIQGLQWEDLGEECVHIRRSVVRGRVDTPKTPESIASIPLLDRVRIPLELYRQQCGNPKEGRLFPDVLNNYLNRYIKPTLKAKKITWKKGGLYCGRRGACTEAIERTNGNYAVAQALLRHKHMTTTLQVYKKQITPAAFKAGMKMLEK